MRPCRHCGQTIANSESRCKSCGRETDGPKVTPANSPPPLANNPIKIAKNVITSERHFFADPAIWSYPILTFIILISAWLGYTVGENTGMMIVIAIVSIGILIWASIREHRKPKVPPL